MDRYQLLKLTDWAGTIEGRKCMQKVVFLMKCTGCPIDADFSLHYYGPYSAEVAQATDVLVQLGLLSETQSSTAVGQRYDYCLTQHARASLSRFEATDEGAKAQEQIAPFENAAKQLFQRSAAELEYAATIAFFHKRGLDWGAAIEKACEFKQLDKAAPPMTAVRNLAQRFVK